MRDLQEYLNRGIEMLESINVTTGKVIKITPNSRAKHRWGQCQQHPAGFTININTALLDETINENSLLTTIIHELIHTVPGCMNHGAKFKSIAASINNKYGLDIKRTTSAAEKGLAETTREKYAKHKFVCKSCGAEVVRSKESKFTKNYTHYRCAKCYGHFEKVF